MGGKPPAARWAEHAAAWRDPAQILAHWADAGSVDRELLRHRASRDWWDILDELGICLVVSREYEHLLVAHAASGGRGRQTFLPLPHPSGIAVDAARGVVHVASTRNPNQLVELEPALADERPLVPARTRYLPGSLYLHDLALVGGRLHGNAVGWNAVVRLDRPAPEPVWWPRSVERDGVPDLERNYLQLNSIAAGATLARSYFSASAERPSGRRPGQRHFPVDGRGVVFSGRTREPVVRGLTRPHSARLHDGGLWVLNSGYGEVGRVEDGSFAPAARLRGWTRGLCFHGDFAFVATSRVIPRFRSYAPGLDVDGSVCGVHAVRVATGEVAASLTWPAGNQVFAVEAVPHTLSGGLPFEMRASPARTRELFYRFTMRGNQ